MIYRKAIKEINSILKDQDTTAIGVLYRTGDQDGLLIDGEYEGISESWEIVEVMLNLLCAEFKNERSAQTLTRFLNNLGYFPTEDEVKTAYWKFLNGQKSLN